MNTYNATSGDGPPGIAKSVCSVVWIHMNTYDAAKSVMDLPALPNQRGYREHRDKGRARGRSWQRPLVGGGGGDTNDGARN